MYCMQYPHRFSKVGVETNTAFNKLRMPMTMKAKHKKWKVLLPAPVPVAVAATAAHCWHSLPCHSERQAWIDSPRDSAVAGGWPSPTHPAPCAETAHCSGNYPFHYCPHHECCSSWSKTLLALGSLDDRRPGDWTAWKEASSGWQWRALAPGGVHCEQRRCGYCVRWHPAQN